MTLTRLAQRYGRLAIAVTVVAAATSTVSAQQATTYEIVSSFQTADGRPNAVIQARNGQFFGTTLGGPPLSSPPVGQIGTVFAMDETGARTRLRTFLINFSSGLFSDGSPRGNLFEGSDGSLYGTTWTYLDSPLPTGQVFKISPDGLFTRLASAYALGVGVIQARDGKLYGVADGNQIDSHFFVHGFVFRVEANGTLTALHRFGSDTDLAAGELVEAADGTLYGATVGFRFQPPTGEPVPTPGTIFQVDPASGTFTIRYRFTDGTKPAGRLIQGTDGLIYGTTENGGAYGLGTVFSLDAAGTLTTLHHFTGADGANPSAGVIQGFDGRLYGVSANGGAFGFGNVFAMEVTGGFTTVHDFAFGEGANPVSELIQATDGAFYGAAPQGGPNGGGVVFRIRVGTPTPANPYFEVVSLNSGGCLDISGGSIEPAAPAIQWTCHGGPNQQWRFELAGSGALRIISRNSGQALDVSGGSRDNGAPIIQWPVHGGDNQTWTFQPMSDGYRIVARHSGKAMDVEFASTNDGAQVIQYTPHGGTNQQWLLRAVASQP